MRIITTKGRFAVLLFLAIFVFSLLPMINAQAEDYIEVMAEVPDGAQPLVTITTTKYIELWHYSGGYWKATIDGSTVQIDDSQLQKDLSNLAVIVSKSINMTFDIPSEVQTVIAVGKKIAVSYTSEKTELFEGMPSFKVENRKLYFKAEPIFHFVQDYNYTTFLPSLTKFIPFVDPNYGYNIYSMYKGSNNVGGAKGYFNPDNPTELGASGTIHPTQIIGSSGKLKPGFTVKETYGTEYNSEDVTIGLNTFANAGAVGLQFVYPITLTFFEDDGDDIPDPDPDIPPPDDQTPDPIPPADGDDVDLASNIIGPLTANAGEKVNIKVQAVNLGNTTQNSTLILTVSGKTQTKDVTLNGGESKELTFSVDAPSSSGSVGLTSNIDPQKKLKDKNWNNNKSTATLKIQYEAPAAVSHCDQATINWSEEEEHNYTYTTPKYVFNGYGWVIQNVSVTEKCNHVYNYQAKLEVDPILFKYDDKEVHQFKSGYGFYIEATTKVTSKQVGNDGICSKNLTREHTEKIAVPTNAKYYAPSTAKPQKVTNRLGTQDTTIDLASDKKNPTTKFTTPANNISEYKYKKIYTDPNWADGRHFFDLRFEGGGVAGKKWCYLRTGTVANGQYLDIKGNMYQDDHTG